jgi:hypothetical protein
MVVSKLGLCPPSPVPLNEGLTGQSSFQQLERR